MGRIWMPGGGGGADLDAVTAGAGNVEAGKVIVGPDGEPISGAVPNLSQNPDAQYATGNGTPVIKGDAAFMQVNTDNVNRALIRYDGASERGKAIIQPNTLIGVPVADMATAGGLAAAKLAQGQSAFGIVGTYTSDGTATNDLVYPGRVYYSKGQRGVGSMPTQGGSTITPRNYAQTAVAANRYVTGNVTVAGDGNLVAANIKKNVTIFGVKGTWEGWVPTATDLYLRGNNIMNFTSSYGSNSGDAFHVQSNSGGNIKMGSAFDLSPYNSLNLEMAVYSYVTYFYVGLDTSASATDQNADAAVVLNKTGTYTATLNISNIHKSAQWYILFARNFNLDIFRIWVS